MTESEKGAVVIIDYTNYRGERSDRRILPEPDFPLWFGETKFHPGGQWLLRTYDLDKQAVRTFAMKDIHSWKSEVA